MTWFANTRGVTSAKKITFGKLLGFYESNTTQESIEMAYTKYI